MNKFLMLFKQPGAERRIRRAQMCQEIGSKKGTLHYHFFVHFKNSKTRSALDKWTGFHWDDSQKCRGTDFENWNYTAKDENIIFEFGEPPAEEGEPSDWERILVMLEDGVSNREIVKRFPAQALMIQSALDRYRLDVDRANQHWRDVKVTFITGPTGCGKTRGVMEKYGYPNVFRTTDRKNLFETYDGHDVLVFEEFRGGIRCEDMLNYLDGYPLELPARYANKLAKYTKVYILTNVKFEDIYYKLKVEHPATYAAWERRIDIKLDLWKREPKQSDLSIYTTSED